MKLKYKIVTNGKYTLCCGPSLTWAKRVVKNIAWIGKENIKIVKL